MIASSRLLAAKLVYEKLSESLLIHPYLELAEQLNKNEVVAEMRQREMAAQKVLVQGEVDDSWTFGISLFGVTTHYKLSSDGLVLIRMEGHLRDLPLFEQLAVIHEVCMVIVR